MNDVDVLVTTVTDRWNNDHQAFFVAQVKPFLAKHGIDIAVLFEGQQVRQYLENKVPALKLIQHEREPTNWAIVPADAAVIPPYSQYFTSKRNKPRAKIDFPYQNALKVAFTRPIGAGQRRWVFTAPARFLDLPATEMPVGAFEVTSANVEEQADETRSAELIENWISQNGLDSDQYRFSKFSSLTKPKAHRSALHQLLALLPAEDLDRVSLPLDVVRKLLDRPEEHQR